MVVEVAKETWGKCSIKTLKHYNEKENIIELWQKVRDVETKKTFKYLRYCLKKN